jgi:hypothetical protein
MDPYLELPARWRGVYTQLIVAIAHAVQPQLPRPYHAFIEERIYWVDASETEQLDAMGIGDLLVTRRGHDSHGGNGRNGNTRGLIQHEEQPRQPGVLTVEMPRSIEVTERYIEVRVIETEELITVIEVLSPTNKRRGEGRQQYERKRAAVVRSLTSLVEVDLLRAGTPPEILRDGRPLEREALGDYRVLISRGYAQPRADLHVRTLREALPTFPVPLQRGEAEPLVDLQNVHDTVYDQGMYERILDYRREPVPPLSPEDAAWADALLKAHGLR